MLFYDIANNYGGAGMEYTIKEYQGLKCISFNRLEELNILKHAFSTREGGFSQAPYYSLNLGPKTKDLPEAVRSNTEKLCEAIGVDFEALVVSDQVHEDNIHIVTEVDKGKGFTRERDYSDIDALITDVPGIPLISYYADCVPLYIVDPIKRVVALAHAGWMGTVLKIGNKTINKMLEVFNSKAEDIIVVIGPSIGPCCYEVDEKVVSRFNTNFTDTSSFVFPRHKDKFMLDLWTANSLALKEIGIKDRNIIISRLCTGCGTEMFFSHRMEGPLTGRMASIIHLN